MFLCDWGVKSAQNLALSNRLVLINPGSRSYSRRAACHRVELPELPFALLPLSPFPNR
jgi:hypothetical protein